MAVEVMPKGEVADPQGATIERALPTLGISGITRVRVGKRMLFFVETSDEAEASRIVEDACRRVLSNPVIEDFE
ncbi:MAG: phosphoribosylformylglycinamidine synthase subunit PurS, partial [Acidimicrobiia bacterium]